MEFGYRNWILVYQSGYQVMRRMSLVHLRCKHDCNLKNIFYQSLSGISINFTQPSLFTCFFNRIANNEALSFLEKKKKDSSLVMIIKRTGNPT